MSQDTKRVAVEGDKEDRISALPIYVIDLILARLPARCAARTCILSKKWRYNWAMHPNLVLDDQFIKHLAVQCPSYFKQAVDGILLRHRGDMVKFVLGSGILMLLKPNDAKAVLPSYENIDRWMDFVTRNGVKKLALVMPFDIRYKLPSCVFNCPTITDLELGLCVIKPPVPFLGFPNLKILRMTDVTIEPTTENFVINLPRLVKLNLSRCDGTQYLDIVSPNLESLDIDKSHYLILNCFVLCNKLRFLRILSDNSDDVFENDERSTLKKFFVSVVHTVEKIHLDALILDLCCADTAFKMHPFSASCLSNLSLSLGFGKLSRISGALQLIKSAPNLSALTISVYGACEIAEAVSKYLKRPSCLDQPLNKLKHVTIIWLRGTEIEFLFTKLLLSRTPSLKTMHIVGYNTSFKEELLHFPRASPTAELSMYGI